MKDIKFYFLFFAFFDICAHIKGITASQSSPMNQLLHSKAENGCLIVIYAYSSSVSDIKLQQFTQNLISDLPSQAQLQLASLTKTKRPIKFDANTWRRTLCSVTVLLRDYGDENITQINNGLTTLLNTNLRVEITPHSLSYHSTIIHIALTNKLISQPDLQISLTPEHARRPITLLFVVFRPQSETSSKFLLCRPEDKHLCHSTAKDKPIVGMWVQNPFLSQIIHAMFGGAAPHCSNAPWLNIHGNQYLRAVCQESVIIVEILAARFNFTPKYDASYLRLSKFSGGMIAASVNLPVGVMEQMMALHLLGGSRHQIIFCDRTNGFYHASGDLVDAFLRKVKTWTGPIPISLWIFLGINFGLVVGLQIVGGRGQMMASALFDGFRVLVRQDGNGRKGDSSAIRKILITFSWICFIILQIYEGRFTSLVLVPEKPQIPSSWAELSALGYKIIIDGHNQSLKKPDREALDLELKRNFPNMNSSEYGTLFEFKRTPKEAQDTFNNHSDHFAFIDNTGSPRDGKKTRTLWVQYSETATKKRCYSLDDKLMATMYYWLAMAPLRDSLLWGLQMLEQSGIYPFFFFNLKEFQDVSLRNTRMKLKLNFGIDGERGGDMDSDIRLGHLVPVFVIMGLCGSCTVFAFFLELCGKM